MEVGKFLLIRMLCLIYIVQGAKQVNRIDFSKFEVVNQRPDILEIHYQLNRTSSNLSLLFVDFKSTEDVQTISGLFNLAFIHGKQLINYVSMEINFCSAIKETFNLYLMQMISVSIRRVSNFPLGCPVKKNTVYYVKGFKLDSLPRYLPEMGFVTNCTINVNNQPGLVIKTAGQLRHLREKYTPK